MFQLRTVRLLVTFYRAYAFFSVLMTLLCLSISFRWGAMVFTALFWFKLASLGVVFFHVTTAQAGRFVYYKNLGLSRGLLWTITLIFDFALFLMLIFLSLQIQ